MRVLWELEVVDPRSSRFPVSTSPELLVSRVRQNIAVSSFIPECRARKIFQRLSHTPIVAQSGQINEMMK